MPRQQNPTSWDEYEGRQSPRGSIASNVIDEEDSLLDGEDTGGHVAIPRSDRRRSSVTQRLAAMADIGGPNSFRSFARSWQRAASFAEVIPRRPSFVVGHGSPQFVGPSSDGLQYGRSRVDSAIHAPHTGLLRQHLQQEATDATGDAGTDTATTRHDPSAHSTKSHDVEEGSSALPAQSYSSRSSIFAIPPHLSTPSIVGSYGSLYGTVGIEPVRQRPSFSHVAGLRGDEGDEDGDEDADPALGEEQPILVKEVKQGQKVVLTVEGQSTLPQSVFNSINAIIGVGLLSLPLAFKMSGWIIGLFILSLTAAVTAHTAKLLGRCMDYDMSLITYSDIAYVAFGSRARIVVSALFTLELVAACVALVILFADSLHLLLPFVASVNVWKCVCAGLILLLNALPLRWLSYTSVVGIFSTFCIVCIVVVDGLIKEHTPGSLREPAMTYLFPSNWLSLPLAYGLMASPWGAHSVFPSIYRDMRHPHKWNRGVHITFSFSYVLDTCLAIVGILMFGDGIKEAITSNILRMSAYPKILTILMCIFITIIPLTKIPLNARPIITTADVFCGLHRGHDISHNPRSPLLMSLLRSIVRLAVVLVFLAISILFPAFDSVCAFLGAALCSLISIILPISFYLKLYGPDISARELVGSWVLLVIFSIFGVVGTVWTFLPKDLVGA